MADFSNWSSLVTAIRNAIANRDLAVGEYRTPDGRSVRFRSLKELQELEGWAAERAADEARSSGAPSRRVYVRPQGSDW